MKAVASIVCLVLVALCAVEARPKRSIILASPTVIASAPLVASSVVATPVVTSHVVQHHPTSTVVKTEQVQNADTSSYSYSTEVRSAPAAVVRTAAVAAVPAVATSVVAHTVPTYATYPGYVGYGHVYGYPYGYAYGYPYAYGAYSPYLLKK